VWSRDNLHPAGARTMVLPGVAAFTRVCAYDRPGTIGEVNPDLDPDGPPFFPSSPSDWGLDERETGRNGTSDCIIRRRMG